MPRALGDSAPRAAFWLQLPKTGRAEVTFHMPVPAATTLSKRTSVRTGKFVPVDRTTFFAIIE